MGDGAFASRIFRLESKIGIWIAHGRLIYFYDRNSRFGKAHASWGSFVWRAGVFRLEGSAAEAHTGLAYL